MGSIVLICYHYTIVITLSYRVNNDQFVSTEIIRVLRYDTRAKFYQIVFRTFSEYSIRVPIIQSVGNCMVKKGHAELRQIKIS